MPDRPIRRGGLPYAVTWRGNPFWGIPGSGILGRYATLHAARVRASWWSFEQARTFGASITLWIFAVVDVRDGATLVRYAPTRIEEPHVQDTTLWPD
jgi:hypothetical protein